MKNHDPWLKRLECKLGVSEEFYLPYCHLELVSGSLMKRNLSCKMPNQVWGMTNLCFKHL